MIKKPFRTNPMITTYANSSCMSAIDLAELKKKCVENQRHL